MVVHLVRRLVQRAIDRSRPSCPLMDLRSRKQRFDPPCYSSAPSQVERRFRYTCLPLSSHCPLPAQQRLGEVSLVRDT
jgi:hypothetical protein